VVRDPGNTGAASSPWVDDGADIQEEPRVSVPVSASEHPDSGRFGFALYHPGSREAWRGWLTANHDTARGVWAVSWRGGDQRPGVTYEDAVEEAICFGWIDSTVTILDDERALQLFTPRKPRGSWTRLNRDRAARMEAAGRMTDAGRRVIEVARANGSWTLLDTVEDLIEPDDLAAALDADPAARAAWDGFPPSARKQMLWWVVSARRPDTRDRRITRIVDEAAQGRRAQG
jgi:uncharacterized protein YdeI (YjbR/CyaY-like superfamily)